MTFEAAGPAALVAVVVGAFMMALNRLISWPRFAQVAGAVCLAVVSVGLGRLMETGHG